MGIVTQYKFNQTIYENFIPEFNSGFTYTITDEIDTDGYTIRTIESDSLPTSMRFGADTQTNREKSLLEVYECDTEIITNMASMFLNCSSLTSLNLSNFNTGQVTTMQSMFQNCSSLTSLDVSDFDTGQVKNMQNMFNNCSQLTSLDLSNWNTGELTGCPGMFRDCKSLKTLDISGFNTENVVYMNNLFKNCESLTTLDISSFKTTALNNAVNMFEGCKSLKTLDISNFNTENTIYIDAFFALCPLENIGMIYLPSSSINTLVEKLDTTSPKNIWYSDAKLEDLTKKSNITYKEYKMNILESDEEIELRSNGNVCDELNLLTCELTQRIDENGEILAQEIIKTINLKDKPSINWQGDTYLHLENNTLYPQLDCEIESINYYEIPKLKANTLYTLRYVGEPTQCIFGGLTYKTENNMILTSGSSDNLLYFDKEVRKVILIEGDVRDRNFDYFEGIESLGAVEIVTHKTNMPIFAKGGRK